MSMQDLEKASELIEKKFTEEEAYFGGIRDSKLIQLAEEALGISFPETYKAFLQKYGFGGVGSCEIYGIIDGDFVNSEVPDAV